MVNGPGNDSRNIRALPGGMTRALTVRACYDCYSNQTVWPWCARIAPTSWLIRNDVDEGRGKLNFSEWDRSQRETYRAGRQVQQGNMPPWYYTLMHPPATLSPPERQALVRGLDATLAPNRLPSTPAASGR
jgi:hypothetical protein